MAIKIESAQGYFETSGGAQINTATLYADADTRIPWGVPASIPLRFQAIKAISGEDAYEAIGADIAGINRESVTIQEVAELVGAGFNPATDLNFQNIQQVVANRWQASNPDWICTIEFPS